MKKNETLNLRVSKEFKRRLQEGDEEGAQTCHNLGGRTRRSCKRSLKDAQEQLGDTKMSTALEIYIRPIPAHQRAALEHLPQLLTNGDELHQFRGELPGPTQQIQ
jgi:hypothetical protein